MGDRRGGIGMDVPRGLGVMLLADGVALTAYWVRDAARGDVARRWLRYRGDREVGTYQVAHVAAEGLAAGTALAAGAAVLRRDRHAAGLASAALAMLTYATVNVVGWGLHRDRWTAAVLVVAAARSAVAGAWVVRAIGREQRGRAPA